MEVFCLVFLCQRLYFRIIIGNVFAFSFYISTEKTFTLRFSPVEIADLAENSMQDLMRSQPNLSFCFRRQAGKFKKKKG